MRLLIIVEDVFEFQNALHFSPLVAIPALKGVKAGDPLELRRPDGSTIHKTLYGFDWPSPMRGKLGLSVSKLLIKADIPVGTEIWKID